MRKKIEACLVCGEEIEYYEESREMECVYCHQTFMSNASCKNGHYVCDHCHAAKAVEHIQLICQETKSTNPLDIAVSMMKSPFVHMHGPENHVLVGAALLAAYHNAGGKVADMDGAIRELAKRGEQIPGGACGLWGCCGAAVSCGIFVSIVTGSTPLAKKEYGLCNRMTSAGLAAIGEIGGPRCCKRNAFLSIEQAVIFCRENLGVEMQLPEKYVCEFSARNKECLGKRCPYNSSFSSVTSDFKKIEGNSRRGNPPNEELLVGKREKQ